jgi:FMN phosphatase YigB (HAD superfamily)
MTSATTRAIDAVIFDLGGVLASNGRHADFARRFPPEHAEQVIRIFVGDYGDDGDHPWHRLERGEISLDENRRLNKLALDAAGIALPPPPPPGPDGKPAPLMVFTPNEPVVQLARDLRAAGLRTGVLTNNVREFRDGWRTMLPFDTMFDDVIDSHEVGMRKPNPAIYQLALSRLGVAAERTAFLDDAPTNVVAADAVGMLGVLVEVDPSDAVTRVRALAGLN